MLWQVKLPNVGSAFNELILGFTNVPCAGVFTCYHLCYYIYICFCTIRPNHRTRKIIKPKVGSYKKKKLASIFFYFKKSNSKKKKNFIELLKSSYLQKSYQDDISKILIIVALKSTLQHATN